MKKILIIGGYGFLGQHIVHYLIKRDKADEIIVLDIKENKLVYPDDFKNVKTITEVNIANFEDMKKHIVNFDIVYLIAASIKYGRRNVEILNLVNVKGSENVRISCEQNDVKKLIVCSSIAATGYYNKDEPLTDEDYPTDWDKDKSAHYGYSKWRGEEIARQTENEDLIVCTGMPAIMLGAGDIKSLPLFKLARKFPILLAPKGVTNYADVRDVARGFLAVEEMGEDKERYFLTSNNISHKQLLKEIAKHKNKKLGVLQIPSFIGILLSPLVGLLEFVISKNSLVTKEGTVKAFHKRLYTNKKAKDRLGWEPVFTLQETIDYGVSWAINEGHI